MKESLRSRLLRYLIRHHGFISSGDLQRIVMQTTSYTAQNVGRRLREMQNDGELIVEYRSGHAWYKAKDGIAPPKQEIIIKGVGHLKTYQQLQAEGVVA